MKKKSNLCFIAHYMVIEGLHYLLNYPKFVFFWKDNYNISGAVFRKVAFCLAGLFVEMYNLRSSNISPVQQYSF